MRYLLFCGNPRTGHHVTASMVQNHPNIVFPKPCFENEAFDEKFIKAMRSRPMNPFRKIGIPINAKIKVKVIGDQRNWNPLAYSGRGEGQSPERLLELKKLIEVKWIHVVRNPYDTIATWCSKNVANVLKNVNKNKLYGWNMDDAFNRVVPIFTSSHEVVQGLYDMGEDILTVYHEDQVKDIDSTLTEVFNFLELDAFYNKNIIQRHVWSSPRKTREKVIWSDKKIDRVEKIIDLYSWLKRYSK